jgi:hypothetical protein
LLLTLAALKTWLLCRIQHPPPTLFPYCSRINLPAPIHGQYRFSTSTNFLLSSCYSIHFKFKHFISS